MVDSPRDPPAEAAGFHGPPVLYLTPRSVEIGWFASGRMQYRRREVEQEGDEALVSAIRDLIAESKAPRGGLALCLGSPFFDRRQMLLSPMPDEEAMAVLERRAANGLGVELDEILFWGQRCSPPMEENRAAQVTWIVHGQRRSAHFSLLMRLRRAKIGLRRVVASGEVLTHFAAELTGSGGHVLVTTTGRAVHAHLFRGAILVQESRLPLEDFERRQEVYNAIVQDVRQLTAFWSKGSRGAPLQGVHLFGFTPDEVDEMRTPLGIAAQGAEVNVLAHAADGSFEAVRTLLLQAVSRQAHRAQDLRVPLPARPARIAAATLVLTACGGVVAWALQGLWSERIEQRKSQIRTHLEHTEGVQSDTTRHGEFVTARGRLTGSLASLEAITRRGLPLEAALAHVTGTLGRVARINHLSVEDSPEGTRIALEASLSDPVRAAAARLEALRVVVESDPRLRDVRVEPASRVPDPGRGDFLTFTFTGLFTGGDA